MDSPFDIPADLDTPVSAFLKLAPFHPRFLLESVEGGERLGRHSFIGFGDSLEVRMAAGDFQVGYRRGGGGRATQAGQPAVGEAAPRDREAILRGFRSTLERAPKPGPAIRGVPFAGGLVGVAGWSLGRLLEDPPKPSTHRNGGPDAAYMAPGSLLVFDHLTRRAALLHDGNDAERVALHREVRRALRGSVPATRNRPGRLGPPATSLDRPRFMEAVGRAKEEIAAGEVYQIVLSVRFEGACDLEPFEVYRALRLLNPSPYLYYCDFGDLAVVGSSPEALARLTGREAMLRPIAGTRPRGSTFEADAEMERELLADPKEAAEHVMLVDLARNDLGRVAVTGSVRVDPYRSVERYSHVMHLVSGVRGVLAPGADAFDLFASSFPAGTVSGAPKSRAIELIDTLEPCGRDLYAGTVGYFGHGGSMDQAIAIRTIVLGDGGYAYQAGAGIVADSLPEREHDEVLAKAKALEAALRLAEEGP